MRPFAITFFVSTLSLVSVSALAAAQRPANLECDDLSGRLGTFHVLGIDKGETGFSIDRDARGEAIEEGRRTTVFYASNGCDNGFELRLSTRALRELESGRLRGHDHGIRGRLSYFDADTQYDFPGQDQIRTTVQCRAYQPSSER